MEKKAYTLIEMVVVIAVIGLILPVLFNIIFVIVNQQIKVMRLSEVKRQGDFAFNSMENVIRNYGYKIYSDIGLTDEQCTISSPSYSNNGSNFYVRDKFISTFQFYTESNRIASLGADLKMTYLTNNNVDISDFVISCQWISNYSSPLITISFKVTYPNTSGRTDETASMTYQTSIRPRGN